MPPQLPHAPTLRSVAIDSNYCDNITLYCERKRNSKRVAGVKVEEKSCVVGVAASKNSAHESDFIAVGIGSNFQDF
jgi:hypothetical protein